MMKADEAMGSSAEERRAERRRRAVVGPLPDSFLRIPGTEVREVAEAGGSLRTETGSSPSNSRGSSPSSTGSSWAGRRDWGLDLGLRTSSGD